MKRWKISFQLPYQKIHKIEQIWQKSWKLLTVDNRDDIIYLFQHCCERSHFVNCNKGSIVPVRPFSEWSLWENSNEGSMNAVGQLNLAQSRLAHLVKMGWHHFHHSPRQQITFKSCVVLCQKCIKMWTALSVRNLFALICCQSGQDSTKENELRVKC
jgi:hypothetical protein